MKDLLTDDEELLAAWVIEWKQSQPTSRPRSAQELCESRADLQIELERRISQLRMLNRLSIDADARTAIMLPSMSAMDCRREFPDFSGFQIKREIGRGGMGIVYEAVQIKLNRPVALKVINGVGQNSAGLLKRLRDEAKALARLNHNHVIRVYDVIDHENVVCLVLEYVDGLNLRERESGASMDVSSAARIAATVARTMSDVHRTGLLHRDLKPANLLQDKCGTIKISDFGIAKLLSAQSSNTVTIDGIGTPSYMAPEQAIGSSAQIGEWTDVYGIGATLYDFLTGRPPFLGPTPLATLAQLNQNDPVPPRMFNQHIPRDLETICLKCLEKDPRKRYPTAAALASDLERFLEGAPISARPASSLEVGCRWCKRNPDRAGLIAAALFGFIAATGLVAWEIIRIHDAAVKADSQEKVVAAALQKARTQEFYATLGQIKDRSLRAPTSWSFQNLDELKNVAVLRPANDLAALRELRSEYTKALTAFDVLKQRELLHGFDPYAIEFSPDGRVLVAGANADVDKVIQIALVDTSTWKVRRTISFAAWDEWVRGRPDGVRSLLFSPDGAELYVGCRSGWIRVFDMHSGEQIRSWRAHENYVHRIRFGRKNTSLISCSKDKSVKKWSLTGELLAEIQHDGELRDLAVVNDDLSPHSARIAVAGDNPLWLQESDFQILKPVLGDRELGPENCTALAAFPHGGGWIKDSGLTFEVLDSLDHRSIRRFTDRKSPFRLLPQLHAMEISNCGRWLASTESDAVKLWDLAARDRVTEIPNSGRGRVTARFHPLKNLLVTSCDDRLTVYDLSNDDIWQQRLQQPATLGHIALSSDGAHVAGMRAYRLRTQLLTQDSQKNVAPLCDFGGNAYLDVTPNNDCARFDHFLHRLHLTRFDGRDRVLFEDHDSSEVGVIKASPDGKFIYFTSQSNSTIAGTQIEKVGTLKVVDTTSGECRTLLVNVESERLWRVSKLLSLAAGARFVVCTSVDKSIRILDPHVDGSREVARLILPTIADCVSLSPDESCCVAGNRQGELFVIDIPSGEIRQKMKAHDDVVKAVTFAGPNLIVTGSRNQEMKLWALGNGHWTEVLGLSSLSGPMSELCASSDGNVVAALVEGETAVRVLQVDRLREKLRELDLDW